MPAAAKDAPMHDNAAIAIDLGGTIEDTWSLKRAWFASRGFYLGPHPLSRQQVIRHIGGDETMYLEMVNAIYSDESIMTHSLCAGCEEVLRSIARDYRIVLLSSRPESQREATLRWLRRVGILDLVADIALVGSRASKLDWCDIHSVSIFVDDDIRHLQVYRVGIETIRIHYDVGSCCPVRIQSPIFVASTLSDVLQLVMAIQKGDNQRLFRGIERDLISVP
jgi:hypothetical protein